MKNKLSITIVPVVLFAIMALLRINADFFYDEVYSLFNFIFVPLQNTVLVYSSLNNHFLSNLINSVVMKLAGTPDVSMIMDSPWKIRIIELFYAGGAVYFMWRMKDVYGDMVAKYAVVILVTTIPFLNYATLVRGYCLSMFLMAGLLYYALMKRNVWTAVFTGLLLYSMPSNAYVIMALAIGLLITHRWNVTGIMGIGVVVAIVAYTPMLEDMLTDPQLQSAFMSHPSTLYQTLPVAFHSFISWRYLLLIPIAIGAKYSLKFRPQSMLLLLCVLIIPFVLAYLKGGAHYDRTFLVLLPAFCLLAGLCLGCMSRTLYPLVVSYCMITMVAATMMYGGVLRNDIVLGRPRRVSILCNYWEAYYHPKSTLKEFNILRSPTVGFNRIRADVAAIPVYAQRYCNMSLNPDNPDSMYVISCEVPMEGLERFNSELGFHNIYLVTK